MKAVIPILDFFPRIGEDVKLLYVNCLYRCQNTIRVGDSAEKKENINFVANMGRNE
jgi:hypothetical protein